MWKFNVQKLALETQHSLLIMKIEIHDNRLEYIWFFTTINLSFKIGFLCNNISNSTRHAEDKAGVSSGVAPDRLGALLCWLCDLVSGSEFPVQQGAASLGAGRQPGPDSLGQVRDTWWLLGHRGIHRHCDLACWTRA